MSLDAPSENPAGGELFSSSGRKQRKVKKLFESFYEEGEEDADQFDEVIIPKRRENKRKPIKPVGGESAMEVEEPVIFDDVPPKLPAQLLSLKGLSRYYNEKGFNDEEYPTLRLKYMFEKVRMDDGNYAIDQIIGRRPFLASVRDEVEAASQEIEERREEGKMSKTEARLMRVQAKKNAARNFSRDANGRVEYEYLIKYKGQSYKHLEFRRAGDLNSAPGQRKNMLSRYLKKLDHPDANVEELEDCEVDESFVQVERILDEKIEQVEVEMTEQEIRQMKEEEKQERRMRSESIASEKSTEGDVDIAGADKEKGGEMSPEDDAYFKEIEDRIANSFKVRKDRATAKRTKKSGIPPNISSEAATLIQKMIDNPRYPAFLDTENPYADGLSDQKPFQPRNAYGIFVWDKKDEYKKRFPDSDVTKVLEEAWKDMDDDLMTDGEQVSKHEAYEIAEEVSVILAQMFVSKTRQP